MKIDIKCFEACDSEALAKIINNFIEQNNVKRIINVLIDGHFGYISARLIYEIN